MLVLDGSGLCSRGIGFGFLCYIIFVGDEGWVIPKIKKVGCECWLIFFFFDRRVLVFVGDEDIQDSGSFGCLV